MADAKKPEQVTATTSKTTQKVQIAAARPLVTVFGINGRPTKKVVAMPDVMLAPIRVDLVNFVHTNMAKNKRQPYAVQNNEGPHGIRAGHQVAAKSWGTGRAVSRVPRVKGGGTHRAGQGAYANMCRGGRMFSPTKVWRRWHRKLNTNQKRYAVCSAVAASAVPALVMARGHRIQTVDEIPLVIESDAESLKKTKAAVNMFRAFHLSSELKRCKRRYLRAGRGKSRNRRWKHRLGPLVVYGKNDGIVQSVRNIRGVDFCSVYKLNLLKLAPGGHVGRLIVWTENAFKTLNRVYGTNTKKAALKKNYTLPRPMMTNSDLNRLINSQEIQSAIRPKRVRAAFEKKRNPLKRPELYAKLNPLFEQRLDELKKDYTGGKDRPTTLELLEPLRKKQKVHIKLTAEEKDKMKPYWKNVFGDDVIFKSSELLAAEKRAVTAAIEAAEREKAGTDLMEALAALEAGGDKAAAKEDSD
mmetsp:Transcript_58008/g.96192  ORF Transcript_58008/g.96192 Transcript_58008/m.96192 type:complete len:469 (-) Transcript_58008:262-1668(-)|eukprot:CAMPEP_0202712296 /NCGR_PEP_ID=MMETSP1385-20130828/37150_1 /ASSEMBLY_ACC=CAM_ASM_000861 /TAXON_ID=933848 /ORGANISM="Elphidium margaritaceum" /LENGTH=468 /DNA_ID=CAMNT_0049372289 /DNA_START=73 /DNA_END=1479 /DNA_ORIENTATION=+